LTLVFGPLLAYAGKPDEIEIDSRFIACPTNDVVVASTLIKTNRMTGINLDPSVLPATWKVLSSPMVTTVLGQPAIVSITEKPSQYFVKQSDGSFQLRQMSADDGAGIKWTVAVTSGSTDESVKLKAKVEFKTILKREELPDVSLDVGKPTIVSAEQRFDSKLKFGAWLISELSGVAYPGYSSADQKMLLMLRIRRVDASGMPIDAHDQPLAR
jgi:hypothetical protein